MRLKTESETGERRARKTLTPRFTDFFTDSEEKNRLFCSLAGFKPREGGYFRNFGWECAAGTLEPLTFTRAS